MAHLVEVTAAEPHQRRAIERGVAADPVVNGRRERFAGLVGPMLLGAVAVIHKHRLGAPVLGLAGEMFTALEDQDGFAARRQPLRQRAATGAGANDDHIVVRHGI